MPQAFAGPYRPVRAHKYNYGFRHGKDARSTTSG